jgi:hypothetical protein
MRRLLCKNLGFGPLASGDACTGAEAAITSESDFFWNYFRIPDRIGRAMQF